MPASLRRDGTGEAAAGVMVDACGAPPVVARSRQSAFVSVPAASIA